MVKAAVIGIGSMGRNHARVYNELAEANLVAVSDSDSDLIKRTAKQLGIKGYSDYRQMLEKERPDVVSIAVPTASHREVAEFAMETGAHVLIEKPIAATVEDGRYLIECAERLGRKLTVGHIVRFNPAIQLLKKKITDGDLGKVYQIVCRRIGPFPARIRDVGVVIDLAPHDLDVMRYLTGLNPERIFAETERRIHTAHEDLMMALLRFSDGVTGLLEINWLTPTKVREVLVLGECGMFKVDDLTQDLYFFENAQANGVGWSALEALKGVSEGQMTRFAFPRYEPLKAELQAFICSVRDDTPVPVSGEDGLEALRLAMALVESGRTHRVIEVGREAV